MKIVETFVPQSPLKTPVLFLIFNRIDTTKEVFKEIQKAKPQRLYIASDGPRDWVEGEAERVREVREYVLKNVNWSCQIKTLFRDKNLGCGKAVSEAITWFFENEEMGIILEDDCVPSLSFFWFCEELLERYKDDYRVWHIGGCNFQDGQNSGDGDYYFSAYNHIWGWAGWASRWKYYRFDLQQIKDDSFLNNVFKDSKELNYWRKIFKKMKSDNPIDTWDYQYTFSMWYNNGLAILPNVNMVSNIGFGKGAFHTVEVTKLANMPRYEMILETHPSSITRDSEADMYSFNKCFAPKPILKRVVNKIKRFYYDV